MGVLFHLVFASWDLGGMPKKQEKLKVQPVQLVRKSEKVKSVVALQPKFRAKPTWSRQMSGWKSRQQGAKQKSQNQARWSSSRCNMYDPFLEPSLLIRRFEILKRTSTVGLKPKWPPYFRMVNFMIIRGRYLKFRPTGPNDLQKAVVINLFIQEFLQKNTLLHVVRGPAVPHVICLQPIW